MRRLDVEPRLCTWTEGFKLNGQRDIDAHDAVEQALKRFGGNLESRGRLFNGLARRQVAAHRPAAAAARRRWSPVPRPYAWPDRRPPDECSACSHSDAMALNQLPDLGCEGKRRGRPLCTGPSYEQSGVREPDGASEVRVVHRVDLDIISTTRQYGVSITRGDCHVRDLPPLTEHWRCHCTVHRAVVRHSLRKLGNLLSELANLVKCE